MCNQCNTILEEAREIDVNESFQEFKAKILRKAFQNYLSKTPLDKIKRLEDITLEDLLKVK